MPCGQGLFEAFESISSCGIDIFDSVPEANCYLHRPSVLRLESDTSLRAAFKLTRPGFEAGYAVKFAAMLRTGTLQWHPQETDLSRTSSIPVDFPAMPGINHCHFQCSRVGTFEFKVDSKGDKTSDCSSEHPVPYSDKTCSSY